MSSNQASSSTSNRWLSNILRPRASSVSVESCLNIHNADPTTPLDARAILPLVESSQPLAARLKHLKAFADLCKSYRFTHLDNVFFAVQDILESSMPREARSTVFDFMTACISGQYNELGMARVTFYSSLKRHQNWEDFGDMYRVLYALCRGGRDISGFEKNVGKLLTTWLDMVLQRATDYNVEKIIDSNKHEAYKPSKIPFLCEIMHLMTDIARFKFAMFEEVEVAHMIQAARRALFSSNHLDDIRACMAFADVVVRYRFVPVMALPPFMDILCAAVMLPTESTPDKAESPWSIYMNLLRSHCAHNAVLTLCRRIEGRDQHNQGIEALLADGAVTLLAEAAWGPKIKASVVESYQIPDSVILMYMRRGVQQGNSSMNAKILECLTSVVQNEQISLTTMEWATVWEIVDFCTSQIATSISEGDRQVLLYFPTWQLEEIIGRTMVHQLVRFLTCIYNQYTQNTYQGPVDQFMGTVYKLRQYLSFDAAWTLLTYYETEHLLLPSADGWLERILELAETFYIPTNVSRMIRARVLSMVTDVCCAVKGFYPEEVNRKIIYPLVVGGPQESCVEIRQKVVDLINVGIESCSDEDLFDKFLDIMRKCTSCKCLGEVVTATNEVKPEEGKLRRSQSQTHPPHLHFAKTMSRSTTASPLSASSPVVSFEGQSTDGSYCTGIPAMCGLVELFETMDVYLDSGRCLKVFNTILNIANNMDDLLCPYGGPKIIALDLLLRLRCEADHRIRIVPDPIGNDNALITLTRQNEHNRKLEKVGKNKGSMILSDLEIPKQPRALKSRLLSYKPEGEASADDEVIIPINDMMDAYIVILSHSSSWDLVSFVLKRLPLQLSNKHLFCGAAAAIEKLRRRVVQWIDSNKLLENVHKLPPTIKRNDLNVHAYNILVVLISYRRFFSKQSQDKIVYAFYMGLRQVTAATKPCIHALTVCCYELPLSVTKMLNEILQRMSQIISVSSVSVHILEFLSGLARLPNLYANFTSDTYKLVFAIALNYLQHSYSSTEAQRSGSISGPSLGNAQQSNSPVPGSSAPRQQAQKDSPSGATSQTALSQYVLIMAYLVITVWFTAVPLRERRKHVSFIIQRLVSANPIGKSIDEQTFTCIDMLSRFSFADVSLSPEKSLVSKILMGEAATDTTPPTNDIHTAKQNTRSWLYGHTLLTLKTASALGWVEITIRRPSGTVSLMCNIENKVRSEDIDYKTLPALLMMQYTPDLYAARMIRSRQQEEETGEETEEVEGSGLGITFDENTPKAEDDPDKQKAAGIPTDRLLTRRPSITQRALLDLFTRTLSPAVRSNEGTPNRTPSSTQSGSTTNRNEDKETEGEGGEAATTSRQAFTESAAETPSQSISLLRKEDQSLDPAFLYMQLSNYPDLTRVMEISPPLPDDETTARSISTLDRTPVVDFHKIGVLYVGKGQKNEVEILANTHGSPDYVKLLSSLGHIETLRGRKDNTGGLDRERDLDGKYAYFWEDQVTKIIFHVATMMPTDLERDPQCNDKKRHIGNDFVTIVYNDSGEDYAFDTLPGHFNFINIVVTPHSITKEVSTAQSGFENSFFKVELQRRPDMPEIGPISDPKLISSQSLPGFVRQMALHANIFAQVQSSVLTKREYVSPWKERLRHIKRVKERLSKANEQAALASAAAAAATGPSSTSSARTASIGSGTIPIEALLDFTKYT